MPERGQDTASGYKNGLCLSTEMPPADGKEHEIELNFSDDALPEFRAADEIGMHLHIDLSDNEVEKITFYTDGPESQEEVYGLLRKKFGKPLMVKSDLMQNAMGARLRTIDARWTYGTDIILFSGASSFDLGSIKVMTYENFRKFYTKREPHL